MLIFQNNRIIKHRAEISRLEISIADCNRLQKEADLAINRQNAAIENVKIDTVYIEKETQKIVTRYATIRDTVTKSIERDSSAENQLFNITDVLRRFYGL
jgi:predicted  nucleic acid-binding Zn-ribbon protein